MTNLFKILIIFTALPMLAQDYKPVLDNKNEWHFTNCNFGCITDVYYTDGDTLVNGKTYKILDGYHYISRSFLLREEVAEKKLYFLRIRPSGGLDEYLLYDFNLQVGDSIDMKNPITPFPQDGGYFRLDSIVPRPLIDGNNYDHFYFSPSQSNTSSTHNAVWIEGAGSLSLINAPGGNPDINGVGALSCMFKNRDLYYSNLDSISGCNPIYMNVKQNNLEGVTITKTPNSELFLLHNTQFVSEISIFTLTGKRLKNIRHNFDENRAINFETYSEGVYLILVKGIDGAAKTFKVIK